MAKEIGYSWCPKCGYWVPEKYFHAEYDKVLEEEGVKFGLIRICDNCLEGTEESPFPVFKPREFQYDPHREDIACIFCDSFNTEPAGDKDLWRCLDCGEQFYPFVPDDLS